jgi:hypothetical protein
MKRKQLQKSIGKTQTRPKSVIEPYKRTQLEADFVAHHRERKRRRLSAPTLKVQHKPPSPAKIEADHPDGELQLAKLNASTGTTEWRFANKILVELLNAACSGSNSKPINEEDVNAVLAAMHGIAPRDEAEAMLAAQMVATHTAAMTVLRRLKGCETIPQQDSAGSLATKLLRTYAAQLEALARYRGKGQQTVRVEHVHVHSGGQAIVGAVGTGGRGTDEIERQPHAIAHSPGEAVPGAVEAHREAVPVASS